VPAPETHRAGRFYQHLFTAPERRRLRSAVSVAQEQLAALDDDDGSRLCRDATRSLLNHAAREAWRGDMDAGWKYLHEAWRQRIRGLDEDALDACIIALRDEADGKLAGWRKEAILKLLGQEDAGVDRRRSMLREAQQIMDDHSDNIYFRNRLLRTQMTVICVALVALSGAFGALFWFETSLLSLAKISYFTPKVTCGAMLLGGMGACFSALSMFANRTSAERIPSHLANVLITATRPLLGMIAGLAAVLCINSGSVNVGPASLLLPFLFGFSDRVVMAALGEKKSDGAK
jgi:hypothetical protein